MEAYLHRLREELASVEAMLYHTTAPNMKALEKIREVKDKFQDVAEGRSCSVELQLKQENQQNQPAPLTGFFFPSFFQFFLLLL